MFRSEVFAENLRKYRTREGLSQSDLAQQLFLTTQAVSKWERGESLPDISRICKIAQILNVSVDMLLGNTAQSEITLIGIDGGGTKTEFVLITQEGALLKRLVLGGSNPNAEGIEQCCAVLKEGIDALLQTDTQVAGIFVGGAGMSAGNNATVVQSVLKSAYPHIQIHCDTDIRNVIACSPDPENCIAAICGTGAVVFASHDDDISRFGGGGYLFDVTGGGYSMGRDALTAAMQHRDGIGPETLLTEMVEKELGGTVFGCIQELYRKDISYIASFTPMVFAAHAQNDPVATEIVERNCKYMAHVINTAARKFPKAKDVVISGSLLVKNETFRKGVLDRIDPDLKPLLLTYPQIYGSCVRCAKLCGLSRPSAELFMSQYKN